MTQTHWTTRPEAQAPVFEWVTVSNNLQRRYSGIGHRTPVEFDTPKEQEQAA